MASPVTWGHGEVQVPANSKGQVWVHGYAAGSVLSSWLMLPLEDRKVFYDGSHQGVHGCSGAVHN